MKTPAEISRLNSEFTKRFGLSIEGAQQGSEAWFQAKLGVISASNASKAVAGRTTDTRHTYMAELVAQVATGLMPELSTKEMEWGHDHEDAARSHYEFTQNVEMVQIPFVFKDDNFRAGCSPDGLVGPNKGAEIKCPFNSVHFIKFLTDEKIKPEYVWQYQFAMWALEAGEWDFVQYDPRMKSRQMHVITLKRDEEKMKAFDDLIPQFIYDMDIMLKKAGMKFGDQWTRIAETQKQVAEAV